MSEGYYYVVETLKKRIEKLEIVLRELIKALQITEYAISQSYGNKLLAKLGGDMHLPNGVIDDILKEHKEVAVEKADLEFLINTWNLASWNKTHNKPRFDKIKEKYLAVDKKE